MINFFKVGTSQSSMRLVTIAVSAACILILVSMAVYILYFGFHRVEISKWSEMGIFLGGIATIITGVLYNKVQQAKVEKEKGTE